MREAFFNRRALRYGFAFAFTLSLCLYWGSELSNYDGLRPGLFPLLLRIAVPAVAALLLAAPCAALLSFAPQARRAGRPIPYIAFFLLFAVCYGTTLLALYPGVISYDFEHEIAQYTSGVYQAAHPVFHTLFLGSLYALGEALFGSMTAGAALYSAVQLLLLAAMYAYACIFIQRRVAHRAPVLLLAAGFALLPFHGVLAVSTAKDPLFAGLCVLLCLFVWEAAEDPSAFLANRLRIARFAACCLLMALLRHNGVFAFVPACIGLLALAGLRRRKALALVALTLLLSLLVPRGLERAVGATKTPSSEMMSVPCQQLMRTANRAALTEHEFDQIERWFPGATHTYRAHCADPAKGGNFNFARYQEHPMAFAKTWAKYGLKHPRVYVEAFLLNCQGIWDPGDVSHAHSLSNEEAEYIYLNTVYPFAPERYPITPDSKLPGLQRVLYAFMHDSVHERVPLLAQLFCPAVYSFMLLLTTLRLLLRGQKRFAAACLPLWGIFLSILFSAGVFIRYAYPIMAAAPLLLVLAFFAAAKTE